MLEQQMYKIPRIKEIIYSVRDLESLSASVLYSGDSGGPKFSPASNFGLGPGIAREMSEAGYMIERVRGPGAGDSSDADHINYEYLIPGIKKALANIHISLDLDKD